MTASGRDPRKLNRDRRRYYEHIRLYSPSDKAYLHLGGEGLVKDRMYSWLGTHEQAQKLLDRAVVQGKEWPFEVVNRNHGEAEPDDGKNQGKLRPPEGDEARHD